MLEMMEQLPKWFFPVFFAYMLVVLILMIMMSQGIVSADTVGICVDSAGRIYVGSIEKITVVDQNGDILRTFSPGTSRGYEMALSNDRLYVFMGNETVVMDLEGTVLKRFNGEELLRSLRKRTYQVGDALYKVYRFPNYSFVTVTQNGRTSLAYHTSWKDVAASIVLYLPIPCLLAAVAVSSRKKKPAPMPDC